MKTRRRAGMGEQEQDIAILEGTYLLSIVM